EIYLHDLPQNRFAGIGKMSKAADASVIHQHVQTAVVLHDLVKQALPVLSAGNIGGNRQRLTAALGKHSGKLVEPILGPRRQGKASSMPASLKREATADSARRPCNKKTPSP